LYLSGSPAGQPGTTQTDSLTVPLVLRILQVPEPVDERRVSFGKRVSMILRVLTRYHQNDAEASSSCALLGAHLCFREPRS
jgi:hypothetical protein